MTADRDDRWPALEKYDDCWPVRSILKLALKYGAEASRRSNTKETANRLRSALRGSASPGAHGEHSDGQDGRSSPEA